MKTGEKIAKARKDINLTQDQLAELLGRHLFVERNNKLAEVDTKRGCLVLL